jgi:mono/diheme cytochrome c family protein
MARNFDDLDAEAPPPGSTAKKKRAEDQKKRRKRGLIAGALALACIGALALSLESYNQEKAQKAEKRYDAGPLATGEDVYKAYCAYCHGFKLDGKSEWFRRTEKDPEKSPALNEKGVAWRLSDKMLFDITKHGGQPYALPGVKSEMPAFEGVITDKQMVMSLDYVKGQWPEKLRAHQKRITKHGPGAAK